MAVNPSTSFVWTGTPATGFNRSHTLVADSQFSQVISTNTPFQVQAEDPFANLNFRFWLGISNATWSNLFPGGNQITAWSNFNWHLYELRIIQNIGIEWWNTPVEITLNLPTVTTYPDNRPSLSSYQVILKQNGVTLTPGSGNDYTTQLNFVNVIGAIQTTNTISKPYGVIPVWDDYANSFVDFPGVTNPTIVTGQGQLASSFNLSGAGGRTQRGSAGITASSTLVAAPGRIKLADASLSSTFFTEAEYLDPTYFDDLYVGGFLSANLILGGHSNLQSTFTLSAQGNVDYSGLISTQSLTLLEAQPGFLKQLEASINSEFTVDALGGVNYSGNSQVNSTFSTDLLGGRIFEINSQADVDSEFVPQGNIIYDVGIQYAVDWVKIEDEYVLPYYYLGLSVDSSVECLPTLLKIAEAALLASSTCETQAGFLKQLEADVLASSAIDSITGVIINSTQALFDADFSSQQLGGRVYNIDEDLAFDFQANFQGNRIVSDTLTEIASDTAIDSVIDLFSGAQSFVSADFNSKIVGGFFLALPLQQYYSQFTMPPTVARIIVLDEYYIDLVVPESRQLFIPVEPRTFISNSEQRQIQVHYEPTTMIVSEETRINKPELGRSYLAGRRTRRVAA